MKIKLKYIFEAEFLDGTKYLQNKLDASIKFPPIKNEAGELQGKSCMSDIQENVDAFKIKRFTLIEQGFLGKKITVDLTDGHFEVDGTDIEVEGERPLPTTNYKFKLIYFRVRRPFFTTTTRISTGEIIETKQGEYVPKYMIGWQVTISGKNYQQKILVS